MRKYFNFIFYLLLLFLVITCKQKDNEKNKDTITEGQATFLVDETLRPLIEDQIQVFESQYDAKIILESKSETEVIQALVNDKSRIAILARSLTQEELDFFARKKIVPRITLFAQDAIALISNKNTNDTLISLTTITAFLQGKSNSTIKGLVFDNPNSSTVRALLEKSGIKEMPSSGVFSFRTNNEVIQYVAENKGMIGVIGNNYIFEPSKEIKEKIKNIHVLSVLNTTDNQYYNPTQNDIAEGKYPLARDLFVVNCQGYSGLGMGFASFIAGETGQRIILKSGLVPKRFPSRNIRLRNTISNNKK